jgi:hypothetical protein
MSANQYFGYASAPEQVNPIHAANRRRVEMRRPLDKSADRMKDCTEGYCDYVFFFYVAMQHGDGTFIGRVFQNFAGADAIAAIDGALGGAGGLAKVWEEFAKTICEPGGVPPISPTSCPMTSSKSSSPAARMCSSRISCPSGSFCRQTPHGSCIA